MTAKTTTRTRTSTAAIRLATVLTALAVLATTTPTARGVPIGPGFNLSASEAARPILLTADGTQIRVLKGMKGPSVTRPAGASPTYVAFRLDKPSELPAGYPTVNVGGTTPHSGPARGPLRLDTLAKTALDAELAKSGGAAVHMPRQTYVVESLSALLGSSSDASTQIWLASTASGGAKARPAAAGGTSLGDTIKGWFNTGTDAVQNLNNTIADAIKNQLQLAAPKPVIYPPLNKPQAATTAAEVLIPPSAADGSIQAAPVPEPASLLVFAAAIGAVALRMRKRRA